MKYSVVILASAMCIALVNSYPVPENERLQSEALDRLVMVEGDNDAALRSKRTIGILRQLFPGISQMIENKVNMITAELFRVLGPVVLRNFLGGGAQGGNSGGGTSATVASPFGDDDDDDSDFKSTSDIGSRVSISFPTFPPDEDENGSSESSSTEAASTTINPTSSTGGLYGSVATTESVDSESPAGTTIAPTTTV